MPKKGSFELWSENDIHKVMFRWAPCFKTNVTAAQPLTDETWTTYSCCQTSQKYEHCCWQRMIHFVCCICWLLAIDYSVEVGEQPKFPCSVCGDWPWTVVALMFTFQWFGITRGFLVLLLLLTKDLPPGLWNVRSCSLSRRNCKWGYAQVSYFTRRSPE
jgi:hypothetical protein